ncbi:MAG TPA: beta-propeller fold lactonase family protein [Bryobacteraceae bacterium]|nr:beta-propeller fold lactonase family protein [Bryobacteraceae bacterium]
MKAPLGTILKISAIAAVLATGLAAQSNFIYTNDDTFTTNTVSGFSVGANGALTPISGSPFSTAGGGTGGGGFAVNRIVVSNGFLYASNGGTQNISAFSIDPNSGSLTPVVTSPYGVGTTTWTDISLAASANGKFLFAGVAATRTVLTFGIGADGSLTQVGSAAVPASPAGMKASADGQYLAVGLPADSGGAVAMFTVAANGALTMVNGVPFFDSGAGNLAGVDINCASTHVFGGETVNGSTIVDAFNIGSGGVLSRVQGSPFAPGVGTNSSVVLLSPNDQFLFVSNQISKSVTVLSVNSAGTLTLVAGSPFSTTTSGSNPSGMATDQAGSFLFVASNTSLIDAFSIAANGSLSPVPGSPFNTNQSGGLLSLAAYPAKTCAVAPVPPPPQPPPPQPPPPTDPPPPPGPDPAVVKIDIRHDGGDDGGDDNHINPNSHGKVTVAVLSNAKFNAPALVDMTSLTFGHTGDEKSLAFCNTHREDANHDGYPDLVCHFYIDKGNFQKGDTIGILKGALHDGTLIQGSDSIHLIH